MLKECCKHGLTEFVLDVRGSYRCRKCRADAVSRKRHLNKERLVEYKGGKCEICGYNKCLEALEFHHVNPENKCFGIGNGDTKSLEKLKEEANKCIMVCANCHRELHTKIHEENQKEKEKLEIANIKEFIEKNGRLNNVNIIKSLDLESIQNDINDGLQQKEIADKYKISISTVRRFLKDNGISMKAVKCFGITMDGLIESFKTHKYFTKVSKIYGISDNGLRKWCKRNNLPTNTKDMCRYLNI